MRFFGRSGRAKVRRFFSVVFRPVPAVLLGLGVARNTVNLPAVGPGFGSGSHCEGPAVLAARRTLLRRLRVNFKQYIQTARAGPNARGDFIRDARDDSKMPDDFETADQLVSYLGRQHFACSGAIEGARAAWRTYRAAKRRAA
jgi:hypothetical protein